MSQSPSGFDFHHLNAIEKFELIGQLWDSLPDTLAPLPMPEWHKQELEQRLADADANPEAAIPWQEVDRRLKDRP
jgi:putative addiction module component (TIGR02574 family)